MLRVSVANPHQLPPGPIRILLFDAQGNAVGDSGEFVLPAAQTQWFDFSWGKIAGTGDGGAVGELGTGRIQVRAVVLVSNKNGLPPDICRPGVELVNEETGHTFNSTNPPEPDRL